MAPIAVSLGDPAGIGPEIIGKAWSERTRHSLPVFFGVGDAGALKRFWHGPVVEISEPAEADAAFDKGVPVLAVENDERVIGGEPTAQGARCALDSLEMAVGLARSGAAGAVVTGPVAKSRLYDIGFAHPGQTEFVAERCGVALSNTAMLLAGPSLRTVPITTHMALRDVPDALTPDLVMTKGRTTARGLERNFGIARPRLVFSGLNPHAGEFGALGREEIDILEPAISQLREEGIDAKGPFAADTMFHPEARLKYDCALCPSHDQALIPLKTLHFDEGVNMTLGLPIVRTAPDHGTAFEIAGMGKANPGAMIAAIGLAAFCSRKRSAYDAQQAAA